MSFLWTQFPNEMLHHKTLAKKNIIFWFLGLRSQHFRHILQSPKLYLMASLASNHSLDLYLSKSLGPLLQPTQKWFNSAYLQNKFRICIKIASNTLGLDAIFFPVDHKSP